MIFPFTVAVDGCFFFMTLGDLFIFNSIVCFVMLIFYSIKQVYQTISCRSLVSLPAK